MLENAPNGFLISLANDLDTAWDGEINAQPWNYESTDTRKLSTYWPGRLGKDHPLRDVYNLYYSKTGETYWQTIYDLDGPRLSTPNASIFNDYLDSNTKEQLNLGGAELTLLGPISNRNIIAGDGDRIVAASPVMTPVVHRTRRLSDETGDNNDEFRADTVLYPSSVGAFGTNTLELGNGNSTVYYDSSFRKISSKKGDLVFLPSFGAFNWSIDWIPGYEIYANTNSSWIDSKIWSSSGPPLISPIPWDKQIINPKEGIDDSKPKTSYAEQMSAFAASPERGDLTNQRNYLYTIFTKRGDAISGRKDNSDTFSRTYLNLRPDRDGEDPLVSRNPVNRLGGVRIVAGEFSENGRAENYSIPSGDKTFFGMDWELWQHLLPENGATLANNPAGQNGQKRAAQHQWHTISFAGGRGNNTFNLGNITDNITNNGLFYSGDASYKISLTHDDYYTPQEILDEGIKFGNVYSSGDEQEGPYVSTVNLNLQAEPNSYSVMVQTADPGEKGNDFFKNVLPWTGAVGYAQKLVKTPLDVNKDYFENWKKKEDIFKEKEGKITITDWRRANGGGLLIKDKEEFEAGYKFLESIPSGQKWWDKPSLKVTKLLFGQVFPWVDLASGAISTVKGLIEFFSSKEAAPPRQEISTTFKEQGLSTGRKAVLINDWNPYTKINLNLPSFSPSDWAALSLSVNKPDTVSSGNNTNKGAYLELTHTSLVNSKTSQVDHPLVILENLDKNDRVDKVQKDGGGFGYYTYSFVDPDGNSGGLIGGEFNPIRSSSLRLFGQLANPKKLIGDDGSSIEAITFPAGFEYRSENNFDMRNDAENYSSFASVDSSQRANHYSRYYMGIDPGVKDRPEWSMAANLSPYTSNVSLEFDSRTHGWYWQPVLKTVTLADGSLDAATMLNPSTQDMDYDASKLWVNDPNEGWISFSFSQLDTNITAYRYSKLATTFYATSTDKDKDGISDGQEEINKRNKLNRQLLLLEGYAESLPEIDQRLLSEELKLYSITQIESVKKITDFQYDGGVSEEACLIVFNSANEKGEQVKRRLVLHRVADQLMPAVAVDSDLRPVTPTDFTFNVIVDPSNPTQRPVYNPSQQNPELMVRYFAGFYDPETDKTQLFEYVATPKEDIDGLSFEEARQLARNRQLPQSIKLDEGIVSHLATIESPAENDSITGWFQGNAWLAADNQADRDIWSFKDVWHWVEGKSTGLKFWYKELGKEGPIDNRYSNWEFGEPKLSYDQGLAVNGDTGKWLGAVKTAPIGEGVTGYLVEYTPFQGLPSLE